MDVDMHFPHFGYKTKITKTLKTGFGRFEAILFLLFVFKAISGVLS
jgi:hypothetical protein